MEIHEGLALKNFIHKKDINITELAQNLKISRGMLYLLYGKPNFDDEIKGRIARALKVKPENIFSDPPMTLKEPQAYLTKGRGIPLYPDYASAGTPGGFADAGSETLPMYFVPGFMDCDLMVPVSGDSMYSDYSAGDIIICKQIHDPGFIQWGHAYLVDTVQGLILKYLYPSEKEGHIKFVSKNEKYPPFEVKKKDAKRFFIVKGKIKKNLI